MTTALDLISRSLRLLGVYAKGESPDASESADALMALNALMGSLSNTPLVYAKTLDTIPLTQGLPSITVGPSGTFVTTRPVQVLADSYIANGNVTYLLDVFTQDQYNAVAVKTTQSIPTSVTPLMNMPDVQLTFYPVPIGGLTLNLWSVKQLQTFPALTTSVSLPPGYDDLIPLELAEALGPEYETELPPSAQRRLKRLRSNIANTNVSMPILKTPFRPSHFNIMTNGSV